MTHYVTLRLPKRFHEWIKNRNTSWESSIEGDVINLTKDQSKNLKMLWYLVYNFDPDRPYSELIEGLKGFEVVSGDPKWFE